MISNAVFLFISGAEIGFILFIVLLVFGADKVPEIARGLGKGMRQIKDATNDIKSEITKGAEDQGLDIDITKDVRNGNRQGKRRCGGYYRAGKKKILNVGNP